MPNINAWLTPSDAPTAISRATDAWKRIQDKPSSVAVWRNGSFHHNETVRMEWGNSTNNVPATQSPNTVTTVTDVIAFGINGHATLTDTDIVEGDELALSGETYTVKDVLITIGELQARCVRIT